MEVNIPTTVRGSHSVASNGSSLTNSQTSFIPRADYTHTTAATTNGASLSTDEHLHTGQSVRQSADAMNGESMESLESLIQNLDLEDVQGGNGGDSDNEGDEVRWHGINTAREEKEFDTFVEDSIVADVEGDRKGILKVTATGTTDFIGEIGQSVSNVRGNITLPKPPDDYVVPPLRNDEKPFDQVDNPGEWDRYYFQPKRSKSNNYEGHFLPTGAKPVPLGQDGKRKCGDWEFHYKGFSNDESQYRRGATTSNLFPKEMEGQLDADILKRLGLTKERMKEVDPLFFFQLLLPLCDTSKSGIEGDPRQSYYTELSGFTNLYAYQGGQGSDYGHVWKNTTAAEILRFDGVLFHDGTLGGSNGALYRRWDEENDCYSKRIAEAMTLTRFAEIKRNLKLCNNEKSAKRGERGYDPGYKYDLIYDTIVKNTNAISKKADENQVIDETTWGHSGYGEKQTGVTGRLRGKKVSKGGQTVLMMDRNRFRIRAYLHRSKIYNELFPNDKTREWSANGPYELKYLLDKLHTMVDGSEGAQKKLFRQKPCITADNFFQNDRIMEYIGRKGFGGIMTSARNSLPKDIKPEFLHKLKTLPGNKFAKVARYAPPIVAVKNGDGFQRVHVSFQSTSSCNISTVNALNSIYNFCELRERGKGVNKRFWVIEMNHARRIYLSTYNGIDVLDHVIKNAHLFYQTWKYWHAPKNHGLAIAIAVAYDIYLECAEGELNPEWKVEKPVKAWQFQSILGKQMLSYLPKKNLYPGDQNLRSSTVIPRKQRRMHTPDREGNVTRTQLQRLTSGQESRGCGDLDKLCNHISSVKRIPKGRMCVYCGNKAYHACGICKLEGKDVALHIKPKGKAGEKILDMCFFNWHNDHCIGLAKEDQTSLRKRKRSDWEVPNRREKEVNREHIQNLMERFR